MGNTTTKPSEERKAWLRANRAIYCAQAANAIAEADVLLFCTGAGWSADSGLAVYNDIAKIAGYARRDLDYGDICLPNWLYKDPDLFYGFWGMCFNNYRKAQPHEGYGLVRRWKEEYFSSSEVAQELATLNRRGRTPLACQQLSETKRSADTLSPASSSPSSSLAASSTPSTTIPPFPGPGDPGPPPLPPPTHATGARPLPPRPSETQKSPASSSSPPVPPAPSTSSEATSSPTLTTTKRGETGKDSKQNCSELAGAFFVYTSNVDHHFNTAGFHPKEVLEIHGHTEAWQCSWRPCEASHNNQLQWTVPRDFRFAVDTTEGTASNPKPPEGATRRPRNWSRDHGFHDNRPVCPNGHPARPCILMFNDSEWRQEVSATMRWHRWQSRVVELLQQEDPKKVVVLEIGCGDNVPTVRRRSETLLDKGATLIRINPDLPDGPEGTIPIMGKGLDSVRAIDTFLRQIKQGEKHKLNLKLPSQPPVEEPRPEYSPSSSWRTSSDEPDDDIDIGEAELLEMAQQVQHKLNLKLSDGT